MRWIIGARSIESRIRIFNIALTGGGGGSEGSDRSWCPLHRRRGSIRESEVMERDKREYLITQNRTVRVPKFGPHDTSRRLSI